MFELFFLWVVNFLLFFTVLAAPVGDTTLKTGEGGARSDVFVPAFWRSLIVFVWRVCFLPTIQVETTSTQSADSTQNNAVISKGVDFEVISNVVHGSRHRIKAKRGQEKKVQPELRNHSNQYMSNNVPVRFLSPGCYIDCQSAYLAP